ncbi:oocyte zinc finger protein XlCOF6-like isoform X2 [Sitophilus oryzae]|uniref:Oocyte zinc finger protein XlCOF6-like isoform X2 n=1 Tax=Sitophilus oryzae TaxID=7048 RepID=A0A6J2YBF3_SITOR|nr:oocyte zinc finger protein XlCOF6-like isoform X2 [Sitophilus oryzae]
MMDNIDEVIELKPLKKTDKKVYKCAICGLQTVHKRNLNYHKKTHLAPEERELFACIHCDKKYTTKHNLHHHIEDNHIDSRSKNLQENIHKCSICGYQTRHVAYFRQHQNIHLTLEERQMFACAHCDKKYTTKYFLRRHLEDNHMDSRSKNLQENIHKCSICGYQTRHVVYFRQHQNIHLTLEERQTFACAHCDKKYTTKYFLRRHLEDNHMDSRSKNLQENIHKCSICGYQTRHVVYFRQHQNIHLTLEERQTFACAHCDKKYTTKYFLRRHLEDNHMDSRSKNLHKCSICGYQTRRVEHFRQHQNIHLTLEERQMFACAHCDKKYTTKYFLRRHLEDNHISSRSKNPRKNNHKCSTCGYQTRDKTQLQRHQKIHLAPDERQLFACPHCDKKYTEKGRLKFHLDANHIDSRSKAARKNIYKCSICGYQTPLISRLQQHQKIHLARDERQLFACAHCDKKYTEKRRLKFHLHSKHIDSRSKEAELKVHKCAICGFQTPDKCIFHRHEKIHIARADRQLFVCAHCDTRYTTIQTLRRHLEKKHIDARHKKIHFPLKDRQLFACTHCDKRYTRKQTLRRHLEKKHIDARNAHCTSSTDEVILDALKIEIDDLASPLDDSKNSECLSLTNEIKSEDFIKTEPEDVAPIMKTEVHDDFNENESATRNVKLEDFIKMEPEDVPPIMKTEVHDDFKYVF